MECASQWYQGKASVASRVPWCQGAISTSGGHGCCSGHVLHGVGSPAQSHQQNKHNFPWANVTKSGAMRFGLYQKVSRAPETHFNCFTKALFQTPLNRFFIKLCTLKKTFFSQTSLTNLQQSTDSGSLPSETQFSLVRKLHGVWQTDVSMLNLFQGTKWNVNFQYPLVVWNTLWLFSTKMLSRMIGMIRWVWIDCWNLSFFFKMSSLDATGSATEPQRMGIRSWVMGLLLPWSGWPSHVKNMSSKLLKWLPPVLSDTENWLELGRLRWDVDIMSLKQNCQVYWIPIWYVSEEMFEWDPYDKKNTITWKLMGDLIQTKFQQVLKLVCIPGTKRKSQLRCDVTPRISWATHFHHHHVLPKYTGPCTLTVD